MKPFVRRIGRVFLIIGITGLLTFIGGVTTLLGYSSTAHAEQGRCPNGDSGSPHGYHVDPNNSGLCDPNAAYYCPSGQIWSQPDSGGSCVPPNPNLCNRGLTWQDPDDAGQCLPHSQVCGSDSTYDATI